MRTGIVVGRAAAALDEYEAALRLGQFDVCLVVGKMAVDFPHRIDEWVSFHAALYDKWEMERIARGYSPAVRCWSALYRGRKLGEGQTARELNFIPCVGGSSGYMALQVARDALHLERVVLAGVPMESSGAHFGDQRAWDEADFYWVTWKKNVEWLRTFARSMSGRTREALGEPTPEWLRGGAE